MKGILQMYDVDANVGYDRAEQDIRERSKSNGRGLSEGARSERAYSPALRQVPVLNVAESLPVI